MSQQGAHVARRCRPRPRGRRPQAGWVVGVFVLLLVLVTCVTLFTTNPERR